VPRDLEPLDVALRLAQLLDAALADDWAEEQPAMAVLWQRSDDPDDLRIAVKPLDRTVEEELAPLADGGAYLGLAHSVVTRRAGGAVRLTVASDYSTSAGLARHPGGEPEPFAASDLDMTRRLRSLLPLEAAR
jgi:hypothetical protein